MVDWLMLLLFWCFGLVWVFFPARVLRFYVWFHGSGILRRGNKPRHIRNAGILWLIVMAVLTYVEWSRLGR